MPVFVWDLDSTIFNVSPRNQDIFDLFCSINAHKSPELLKASSSYRLSFSDWGLEPYTKKLLQNDKLKNSAVSFWKKHFFSGTFLHSDRPYPFVIDFIKTLKSKGAKILYLTGRDVKRMRAGSLNQLRHWGLPLDDDADLITKPHKGMKDGEYKNSALSEIFKMHPKSPVFFFDNEPAVLKHCEFEIQKDYSLIFVKSTHSNRATPNDHWLSVGTNQYEKLLHSVTTLKKG